MSRPNVLFIVTDDQGPWAYGSAGDPDAQTPNLDRLCNEGARLTNYFCMSPVCSAARSCLMTSRYTTETGIHDYLSPMESDVGLDPAFATWPRCLEDAGYATALVGKWHLGKGAKYHPTQHGYQEYFGEMVGCSVDPTVEVGGVPRVVEGYTPDVTADFGIDFIRRVQRRDDTPFLLSLHFFAPHANTANRTPEGDRTWLPVSEEDWAPFCDIDQTIPEPDYPDLDIPRLKRMRREYLASVHSVDRNVGRILDELKRLELDGDTLVVFTSDNGYNLGHNGIWHKGNGWWILTNNQGNRPNLYDNSLRVPGIVRWPGVIPPWQTIDATLSHMDWFPTLLEVCEASVPDDTILRGQSMCSLLKGEGEDRDRDLFAQYEMWDRNQNGAKLRSFRTPEWKLIRDFKHQGADEFYDVKEDPGEHQNLINSSDPAVQKVREELNDKMIVSMQEIDDPRL